MNRKLRHACAAALQDTFHVGSYRPGQKAAVSALLSGRDLLCILPTGAGKSLCWQLPAVVRQEATLVISPLIALMQDQVRRLTEMGIPSVSINSLMTVTERKAAEQAIGNGCIRAVFVSPEMLESRTMMSLCQRVRPWLVVVDEAHCIVEWGASFRPAYAQIGAFIESLALRPVICAMTATADEAMQSQIVASLRMVFPKRVTLPVIRPNLHYHAVTTVNRTAEIIRLLSERPSRTVIFCRSRARTELLAAQLRKAGRKAEYYHAGLEREERLQVQERFRTGATDCLAATTAFGMGVDMPDIRCVIHDALPDSVTEMVQQSGRAGRDGKPADCVILISPRDLLQRNSMLRAVNRQTRFRPLARYAAVKKHWLPLRRLLDALMAAPCIPAAFSEAFGQRAARCGCCSACRKGPLIGSIPQMRHMSEKDMHLWLLTWQRDALAAARGVRPGKIMTRRQLRQAVRACRIPALKSPSDQAAMDRIMASLLPSSCIKTGQDDENDLA